MNNGPILLVEDNPDDELLTKRALRGAKVENEIVVAHDGAEALEFLHGAGPPEHSSPLVPAVVLLDLKLPKVDGLEVLRQIRENERTKNFPVVVLTSSSEQEDVVRSYALGVNSYVRKPVEFKTFIDAVGQLGLYWLLLNKSAETVG
jgi:two-component system response regulator